MPAPSLGGFTLNSERGWYYVLLIVAALVVMFGLNLSRTYIGRAWVAIRDRDIAAETIRHQRSALQASRLHDLRRLAALAGSLGAYFTTVVTVEEYTLELAIIYLAMIIVGGMGSVVWLGARCGLHHLAAIRR